jgi:hypothetical protein
MYSAEINRSRPAALLLLIDQSMSMGSSWGGTGATKAQQLALAVNRILGNAVLLCCKGDERVYDYFEVGILGYGKGVQPILHGSTFERPMLPISELAHSPRRIDQVAKKMNDGAGGLAEVMMPIPIWVDPVAHGTTPMVEAMTCAEKFVSTWCADHSSSFPPIVINITDGESTDGDPRPAAGRLRELGTEDGATLLFNVHLTSGSRDAVAFPATASDLPGSNAAMLFEMSSVLPGSMATAAAAMGYGLKEGAKGFLYNADAAAMVEFLDIGTRAVTPTGLLELTVEPEQMR